MSHNTSESTAIINHFTSDASEGSKIAKKCKDICPCARGHFGYTHYRINDRSECPKACSMNVTLSQKQIREITGSF